MDTKLTLRLDSELIKSAKKWSKKKNISLSKAVANFFENMETELNSEELSPWTQSLVGVGTSSDPEDQKAPYYEHLDEKYSG